MAIQDRSPPIVGGLSLALEVDAMPLFVTVSEGPRADQARPVLATGDQRIIGELLRAIGRLGDAREEDLHEETPVVNSLRVVSRQETLAEVHP